MSVANTPAPPPRCFEPPTEADLAEVLDVFADGFCLFDREWRFIYFNRAAEAQSLVHRNDVLGQSLWEVSPGLVGSALEPALAKVMFERVAVSLEFASLFRPGLIYAVRSFPVEAGIGLTFRDITEHYESRRREREQSERLELLFAASGLGDFTWDMEEGVITFSERAATILGAPSGPLSVREAMQKLIHPDDVKRVWAEAQAAMSQRISFEVEHRAPGPDGRGIWVMGWARTEYDEDGRPLRMLGVIADITKIKNQDAKIRESEARFRIFANCAPAPLWVTGPDDAVEFVNQAALDFSGRPAGYRIGGILSMGRMHPDDLPRMIELRTKARARQEPYELEVRLQNARDEWRWMRIICRPRHDHDGSFAGYVGMAMDVTESREAEARQRLLINELNHRVKNTLATVQSIALQTIREGVDAETARQTFVDRLLALSAAHNVLTRQNWVGADLVEIVAQSVKVYSQDHAPRIHIRGPDRRLEPHIAVGLSMALHELATNAAKYGALSVPEGHVWLAWREASDGGAVVLRWRERKGPPVRPPSHRGFGTRLLTHGLAIELGCPAELAYGPRGLVSTFRTPIVETANGEEASRRMAFVRERAVTPPAPSASRPRPSPDRRPRTSPR
jgi:PAS domain S-box-containing protein